MRFEQLDRPDLAGKRLRTAGFGDRQRQALQPVVLEHDLGDFVGHPGQQAVALRSNDSCPRRISRLSGILMLTSLSEQSTPAQLSMKSVLMRPPRTANSIRPRLGDGEVGAFADDLGADFVGVGPKRIVGRVADVGLGLGRRLDVRADAAEPEQVDRAFEDGVDQARRVEPSSRRCRARRALRRSSGIDFSRARDKCRRPSTDSFRS